MLIREDAFSKNASSAHHLVSPLKKRVLTKDEPGSPLHNQESEFTIVGDSKRESYDRKSEIESLYKPRATLAEMNSPNSATQNRVLRNNHSGLQEPMHELTSLAQAPMRIQIETKRFAQERGSVD
jgi:hypothetical protein